jgi:hypothetical protein
VSAERITHELVRQVANDLRARYGLDDEDMRALGSRLADSAGTPSTENIEFAKRFTEEHRETFDRLAKYGGPNAAALAASLEDYIEPSNRTAGKPTDAASLPRRCRQQ